MLSLLLSLLLTPLVPAPMGLGTGPNLVAYLHWFEPEPPPTPPSLIVQHDAPLTPNPNILAARRPNPSSLTLKDFVLAPPRQIVEDFSGPNPNPQPDNFLTLTLLESRHPNAHPASLSACCTPSFPAAAQMPLPYLLSTMPPSSGYDRTPYPLTDANPDCSPHPSRITLTLTVNEDLRAVIVTETVTLHLVPPLAQVGRTDTEPSCV